MFNCHKHHRDKLPTRSARLHETESLGVDVEEAGARSDNGNHEGVAGVEGDGVAHEGEGKDGLEDAGADNIAALAHWWIDPCEPGRWRRGWA